MEFNKLVFGALTVGFLAAAGGGAYLAVRQNQADPPVSTAAPDASASAPAAPDASASAPETAGELRRDPAEAASGREGGPD